MCNVVFLQHTTVHTAKVKIASTKINREKPANGSLSQSSGQDRGGGGGALREMNIETKPQSPPLTWEG